MPILNFTSIEGSDVGASRYEFRGNAPVGYSYPLIFRGLPNRPKTISLFPSVGSTMKLQITTTPIYLIEQDLNNARWVDWTEGEKSTDYQAYTYASLSAIRVYTTGSESYWEVAV